MDSERCGKMVWDNYRPHQCARKWKVEEDGGKWCKQHAPSAAQARADENDRKYREKMDHKERARRTLAWMIVIGELEKHDPALAKKVSKASDLLRGGE